MEKSLILFAFDRFAGMNNVEEYFRTPTIIDRAGHKLADMSVIENLDIDNSYVVATRPGCDLKLSGTSMHSLWSDGDLLCLFVEAGNLCKLNPGYVSPISSIIGSVGNNRMSYAKWGDRIYLTNSTFIGYFNNGNLYSLTDPELAFKVPLPCGQFIAYYRGRLYVAKRNVLYISDALCDHYDVRTGYRQFESDITMLISADNGLYVSDGVTWFLAGGVPEEFGKDKVFGKGAIPYTGVSIDGKYIDEGLPGNYVLWTSVDGICLGDGNGKVRNVTCFRYAMPKSGIGGAVVRNINGTIHYIVTLE
jgi:hypothetical protein